MAKIREILAVNIKEYRRRNGITQSELAERSNISTNFMGMIEQERKFPAPEILDRIAAALGIDPSELFSSAPTPQNELEKLRKEIIGEVVKTIKQSLAEESKKKKKKSK